MEIPGLSTLLSDYNSPTLFSVVQVYANELVQQLVFLFWQHQQTLLFNYRETEGRVEFQSEYNNWK